MEDLSALSHIRSVDLAVSPLADLPRYGPILCEYIDLRELGHTAPDESDTSEDSVHVDITGGERPPPEPGQSSGSALARSPPARHSESAPPMVGICMYRCTVLSL
jgi:hypothetical protein